MTMFEIIANWHWPTFFVSIVIFFVVISVWNVIKTQVFKIKSKRQVEIMDASLKELQKKLEVEDKKLQDIVNKIKPPSK